MTTHDDSTRGLRSEHLSVRVFATTIAVAGLVTTMVACQGAAAPQGSARTTPSVTSAGPGSPTQGEGGNAFTGAKYVTTGALPELPRTGQLFRLPTATGLRSIASAFAVAGPVVSAGTGSVIEDRTRRVSLSKGRWSVTLKLVATASSATSGCVTPDSSPNALGTCTTTTGPTPTDELSPAQKRLIAGVVHEVLRRSGVDVGAATPRVTGRYVAWTASVSPIVAGLPTVGLESVVSGSGDKVELGHGSLTSLTKTAMMSLIGVPAGVEQLNHGLLLGPVGAGDGTPTGSTLPVRRIVSVRLVLAYLPMSGSDVVPAYQFSLADGGTVTTPAVASAGQG